MNNITISKGAFLKIKADEYLAKKLHGIIQHYT
jgi:hypothetical protein